MQEAALSWRQTPVYLYPDCIRYPPQTKKKIAKKFLARGFFSVTKPKPSATRVFETRPAGFGKSHDDMCGFECALLARRVKASPRLPELRGAAWGRKSMNGDGDLIWVGLYTGV